MTKLSMAHLARSVGVFLCIFCGSAACFANEPSAEELAVARELFEKAQAAEADEDWAMCEEHVSEAVEIIETPGLRFHLAFCKERQGRWVEALVDYKRASELVTSGVEASDVEELLGPAIERLEKDLPKLTLLMDDMPEGTTLYLDGQERSTRLFGKAVPVDPGGRRITVSAPGYQPFSQHINLLSKERRQVQIKLVPKKQPRDKPVLATTDVDAKKVPGPRISPKAWVLLAEGAVTLGGLGVGVFYASEKAQLERNRTKWLDRIGDGTCAPTAIERHEFCDDLASTNENLDLASSVSVVGYVTAGVGLSAFVATWLLWDDSDTDGRKTASRKTASKSTASKNTASRRTAGENIANPERRSESHVDAPGLRILGVQVFRPTGGGLFGAVHGRF